MNKQITLLILGVVLCAMALILYFHTAADQTDGLRAGTSVHEAGLSANATSSDETSSTASAASGTQVSEDAAPAARETAAPSSPPSASTRTDNGQGDGAARNNELPRVDPPLSSQNGQTTPAERPESSTPSPDASGAASGSGGQSAAAQGPADAGRDAGSGSAATAPSGQGAAASRPDSGTARQTQNLSLTGKHTLKKIGMHFAGQRMVLRIEAEDPFPCKTFTLTEPERLVVDLPGVWTGVSAPTVPKNNVISGVRYGIQKAGPRLVLDLEKPAKYEVTRPSPTVVEIFVQ